MATQKSKVTFSADDIMTIQQAADELGVHNSTVYRWIQKGEIRPFRIANGQIFVIVDEMREVKERREQDGIVYTVHRPIKKSS